MLLAKLKAYSADRKARALTRPQKIGVSLAEWRTIASRVKERLTGASISTIAAGIAFYFFLALFPVISLYGLVENPIGIHQQLTSLSEILPKQAQFFLDQNLTRLATHSTAMLSAGVTSSTVGALDYYSGHESPHNSTKYDLWGEGKAGGPKIKWNCAAAYGGESSTDVIGPRAYLVGTGFPGTFGLPTDIQALVSPADGVLLALSAMLGLAELNSATLLPLLGTLVLAGLSVGLMAIFAFAFFASFSILQFLISPLPWLLLASW